MHGWKYSTRIGVVRTFGMSHSCHVAVVTVTEVVGPNSLRNLAEARPVLLLLAGEVDAVAINEFTGWTTIHEMGLEEKISSAALRRPHNEISRPDGKTARRRRVSNAR